MSSVTHFANLLLFCLSIISLAVWLYYGTKIWMKSRKLDRERERQHAEHKAEIQRIQSEIERVNQATVDLIRARKNRLMGA